MPNVDAIVPSLPKDGLIRKFIEYTEGGEICPRFRFFPFIAALGALTRRKVWFQRSSSAYFPTLFPNPWIVLVAPQGIGHKSAALRLSRVQLKMLPEAIQPSFLAAKLTPEALLKALASPLITPDMVKGVDPTAIDVVRRKAQGILYSSELGVLFDKKEYNKGMIPILTDLYDCPDTWNSDTVMRGDQMLYEVCLTIMGASTPDWMQSMLPQDAFKGGFMSRLLLVGFPEDWHPRVANPPPPNESLGEEVRAGMEAVSRISGEMKWGPGAEGFFTEWYENLPIPEPGPVAAYLERKQDHILRIAMVLQLAKNRELTLSKEAIEESRSILDAVEPDTLQMVEYISIEPKMRLGQRILEYLKAKGGSCPEEELLDAMFRYLSRPQEWDDILVLLARMGRITAVPVGGDKPGVIYKLRR